MSKLGYKTFSGVLPMLSALSKSMLGMSHHTNVILREAKEVHSVLGYNIPAKKGRIWNLKTASCKP